MKPGQLHPNEFEIAILEQMAYEAPFIREFIDKLHVLSREFTGAGSYTNFSQLTEAVPDIGNRPISLDSLIVMPGVENGMGATLFFEEGHPKFLETYTYGDVLWGGEYDGFSIEKHA